MSPKTKTVTQLALNSIALQDAWTDFILSRQAALCTEGTIKFYAYMAGFFVQWLENQGVTSPEEISARHARAYLAGLTDSGLASSTITNHARAVRIRVCFW